MKRFQSEFMTTVEAAKFLKRSVRTIQRQCREGVLPAIVLEGKWLICRKMAEDMQIKKLLTKELNS